MLYPEISSRELIEKFDSDDFYKVYGNPVKCKIFDTDRILMYWSRFLVTLWSENNYFDLASIGVKYPLAECGLT